MEYSQYGGMKMSNIMQWMTQHMSEHMSINNVSNSKFKIPAPARKARTANGSMLGMIYKILESSPHPMAVPEILDELHRREFEVTAHDPKNAISLALSRDPNCFTAPKPNQEVKRTRLGLGWTVVPAKDRISRSNMIYWTKEEWSLLAGEWMKLADNFGSRLKKLNECQKALPPNRQRIFTSDSSSVRLAVKALMEVVNERIKSGKTS